MTIYQIIIIIIYIIMNRWLIWWR